MSVVIVDCSPDSLAEDMFLARLGLDGLNADRITIHEKGLRTLVPTSVGEGRTSFAPALPPLDTAVDAVVFVVASPARAESLSLDLIAQTSAVEDTAEAASAPLSLQPCQYLSPDPARRQRCIE